MKVLFVCTGNTCRSSMAEALAKKWLQLNAPDREDIKICSAGLAAFEGSEASRQAIEVMGEKGINLTEHRARLLNKEMVDTADIIVTMTRGHKMQILRQYPYTAGKLFTLAEAGQYPANAREHHTGSGEYDTDSGGHDAGSGQGLKDISDPFGQSLEIYRQCARDMEDLINVFLRKIIKKI